ncbi:MAG TPA: hypothetical protein GX504_02680 [Clostridia bacterium]|nr:hypothetical protein [Clostridia bacterium]
MNLVAAKGVVKKRKRAALRTEKIGSAYMATIEGQPFLDGTLESVLGQEEGKR